MSSYPNKLESHSYIFEILRVLEIPDIPREISNCIEEKFCVSCSICKSNIVKEFVKIQCRDNGHPLCEGCFQEYSRHKFYELRRNMSNTQFNTSFLGIG